MNPLLQTWLNRPFSYSQKSSWDWDKEQWYRSYILGEKDPPSAAMLFGNEIGESFATPTPRVHGIVTYCVMEYPLEAKLGDIKLVGYADSYCPHEHKLREYKTSQNKKRWTTDSVHTHEQLTMYALILFLKDKVRPEELTIHLDWIETRETGDFGVELVPNTPIHTFETKRTMHDILTFAAKIKTTRKDMLEFATKRLSTTPQLDKMPT